MLPCRMYTPNQQKMKYLLPVTFLLFFHHSFAQKIVLATYQYADNNRLENIRPLSRYLSDSLGITVDIISYPSVHRFMEGIQKEEVHIALINTFGYLLLESSSRGYPMKPYAVLKVPENAADNYKTAILARKNFPADSLADLKRAAPAARLGLVNPGSTSGNLIPRLILAASGISSPETTFQSVEYCGNHRKAVEMLLEGKTDICATGSTEYFRLLSDEKEAGRVKLLWLSPEIPLGPVLLHDGLSETLKQQIIAHLLKLDKTSPAALEAVKSGWSEAKQAIRYMTIDKHYYDFLQAQFGDKMVMENILRQFTN